MPSPSTPAAERALPVVDAHQHFWNLERLSYPWLSEEPPPPFRYGDTRPLRRNYLPPDYFADAAGHEVVATVHVEAECAPAEAVMESRWLHILAAHYGVPNAIVAQARLDAEDVAEVLASQAGMPLVRGIRHKPAAAASPERVRPDAPGSMSDPRWREGYALLARHGLSFDLQVPWWHLGEAAELARDFPDTPIVLNHTGLPADRSPGGLAGWRRAMATLAAQPNVAVKISGLGQPGQPWTVEANRQVVRETIGLFGVERCLFASNYPVDGLVAGFDAILSGFRQIVADYPAEARRALFHGNARRVYRIG